MKNALMKTFLFLTTLLLFVLISFLSYSAYSTYRSFNIAQNVNNYIFKIKHKNKTLRQLELERIQSALYLGYDGKVEFKNLQNSRVATDKQIEKDLKNLEALQYVRSRVDVINLDYKSILFDYYQKDLMDGILTDIKDEIDELSFGIKSLQSSLIKYYQSTSKRNNLNKQRSFLTFILSSSKKMDDNELLLWEKLLENHKESDYDIDIIYGAIEGKYKLNINQWFQEQTKKELDLVEEQTALLNNIKSNIPYKRTYPDTFKYILMALPFLILLLIFNIKALRKRSKTKTTINNKYIVRKNQKKDKSLDMPLSNMETQTAFLPYENQQNRKTFNPMEEFLSSTKHFINLSAKKKIKFNYFIDPAIPTLCIGEIEKVQKALNHLINYVISTSKSRKSIKFNIENIASTKFESAIRFSIEDKHSQFTKEEKKQILSIVIQTKKDKTTSFDDIRDDLIYINELVHSIGGVFKIENKSPKGAIFHITMNFHKTN